MNDFLCGPGFVAVTQSFGWPAVKTWSVWHAEVSALTGNARFASRELIPVRPYALLDEVRASETRHARELVQRHGALAAVAGFEPTTWSIVRFQLWEQLPLPAPVPDHCLYDVGHVSAG